MHTIHMQVVEPFTERCLECRSFAPMGVRNVTLLYQTQCFRFRPRLLAHFGTPLTYYGL